ncbi:MAG: Rpn family recombination-promoting nuclease/putative transposase [Bacteroidales bacterium]|jgi:predicted transposase/invertase (TIGR01784 family)|nr:Rpn family recombination-promoting nuclease/putative transposase [Bacteroidales bacterium]
MKYLDPKNDLIFKRIFGHHKDLCISLLNSMLPLSRPIVSIEYEASELVPDIAFLKNSIVDVKCTDSLDRIFIVEMQMEWSDSFQSRVLFNASKAYIRQMRKGDDYKLLYPVYALSLVNDIFDSDPQTYYHHYQVVNIADTRKQIKGLELVFIELPKFKPGKKNEKKLHDLWMRFLTEIDEETHNVPKQLNSDPKIRKALSLVEESAYSEQDMIYYEKVEDAIRTHRTYISDALAAIERGKEEGKAQGIAEGIVQGRAEGERNKTIEIVKNSFAAGIDIEQIAGITGLPAAEIVLILNNKGDGYATGLDSGKELTVSEPRAKYTAKRKVSKTASHRKRK